MSAYRRRDRFIFEGKGVYFLRLKAKVTQILGADLVVSEGREIFSIPWDAVPSISTIFSEFSIDSIESKEVVLLADKHALARDKVLEIIKNNTTDGLPTTWIDRLENYQAVAVKSMIVPGLFGLCIFDEQGTGKTVMAIAAYDLLMKNEDIECALIVCPKSVLNSWEKDFATFASEYNVITVSGAHYQKVLTLSNKSDVYLISYESIPNLLVRLKAFAASRKCLLIADESFNVKNLNASRSVSLRELRNKCGRAFVLCGTPAPNDASDLVSQFNIADAGYTFRGFTTTGDSRDDAEIISRTIEERGIYLRRLKSEVLPGLPVKKFVVTEVRMKGSQARLYDKAKEDLILYLKTINNQTLRKNLTAYFAKRTALLQICACPIEQDPLFFGIHAKIKELDKLLNRLIIREGRKVVIWSFYRSSLNEISLRYKNYGLVKIDGGTSQEHRKQAINQFQKNENVRVFVGNPAAAGAGITLHAAADSIFLSLSDQAAQFLQALDRTHRIGQKSEEVRYHIIICKDTIERNQIKILHEKEMVQHGLFHTTDEFPSSLEDALAELEAELDE